MSKLLFYFKTVQTNPIRVLFESLKNILSDVNFKVDKTGIKLTTMDGTETAIVNLILHADKFEEYICEYTLNLGMNLTSIYKILKSIKNMDTISFSVYEDKTYIYITTENSNKKFKNTSKIKLLDLDEKIYSIPDIQFDSFITMPSSDFQSYISDLSIISHEVNIRTDNNKLLMTVFGDFAEQTITINETNCKTREEVKNSEMFNIKFIQLFTKSTNLCSTVEIYLKSRYPLTLIYNVANLGCLKYCLAPVQ